MFRKIVSNLPFSPAIVGQLGFYAKRLRKEETTRRLTLLFVVMALIVQSLAVFKAPESANASSQNDLVVGGISSINDFLTSYDNNTRKLKDIMDYTGITRDEIASTKYSSWIVDSTLSWGFFPKFSYAQGERQHNITDSSGNIVTTVYSRPLSLWTSSKSRVYGWVGYSKSIGWFAIMKSCGNLVTTKIPILKCAVNPDLAANDEECKVCPGNESLWINDPACEPEIVKNKSATNTSQGFVDATTVAAQAGDQISYTVTIKNTGLDSTTVKLEDDLTDTLEYAGLTDNGGGTLNSKTGVLSWSDITLGPNDKQTRTFVVKILDEIPATAKGQSDGTSYDCKILNTFGDSTEIGINCPTEKIIETVTAELPTTGPTENLVFAGVLLAVVTFFYARTRQINKEIHIIRRDSSAGII